MRLRAYWKDNVGGVTSPSKDAAELDFGLVTRYEGEAMTTHAASRTYKDSVFRDLFGTPENKQNALSLYNALNGSHYDNPMTLSLRRWRT